MNELQLLQAQWDDEGVRARIAALRPRRLIMSRIPEARANPALAKEIGHADRWLFPALAALALALPFIAAILP